MKFRIVIIVVTATAAGALAADPEPVLKQSSGLQRSGRLQESAALIRGALATERDLTARQTALLLNELALAEQTLEHYDIAEQAYRQALTTLEGDADRALPTRIRMNLVCLLIESGQHKEAGRIWGLDDIRTLETPRDVNQGKSLLASVAQASGDLSRAENLVLEALAGWKQAVGNEATPEEATALNNLGTLAMLRSRWKPAEEYLQRAVQVWRDCVGAQHPNLIRTMTNLGYAQMKLRRWDEAAESLNAALKMAPAGSRTAEVIRDEISELLAAAPKRTREALVRSWSQSWAQSWTGSDSRPRLP